MRIDSWWQSFKDPKLNELVERAKSQNLSLKQAYERIVEARANLSLQGGQLGPNASLISEYSYTKRSQNARPFVAANGDPFDLFNLGIDSSWQLDLFGKAKRGIEAANAELEFQGYEFEYIRQTLYADIVSSYLRVRLLQEQVGLIEESLLLQSDTAILVFERTEAGVSTELDRSQTEAFRFRTRALLASIKQDIELEFNQLGLLIGQTPDMPLREFVGMGSLPSFPTIPEVGVPADLLRRRPDVWREEMAVKAASARIGVAEADLYPQLSLLGAVSVSSKNVSGLFETNGLSFSVGPSLQWNIFQIGPIFDNIEIQESRLRQSIFKFQETVLTAVREVEDALIKRHGSISQWNAFSDAIESDQKAVELSLERYRSGKTNFQRVLDAQQQLLQDRRDKANVQAEAIIQTVRLYQAAGGGWESGPCIQTVEVVQAPTNQFQSGFMNSFPAENSGNTMEPQTPARYPTENYAPTLKQPQPAPQQNRPNDDDSFEIYELENVTPPMPKKQKPMTAEAERKWQLEALKASSGSSEPGAIPVEW